MEEVQQMEDRIEELERKVAWLENDLKDYKDKHDTLQGQVSDLQTDLADYNKNL